MNTAAKLALGLLIFAWFACGWMGAGWIALDFDERFGRHAGDDVLRKFFVPMLMLGPGTLLVAWFISREDRAVKP